MVKAEIAESIVSAVQSGILEKLVAVSLGWDGAAGVKGRVSKRAQAGNVRNVAMTRERKRDVRIR